MLRVIITAILLAFGSVAANSSVAQAASPIADEQQIRQIINQWLAAIVRKDATAIAQFYAPNGAVFPPGAPKAEGREAIAKVWGNFVGLKNFNLTFAPTQIVVASGADMASDVGVYSLSFENDSGPVRDTGKYVVVWQKVDGVWKAAADIFNSNGPTP